MAIMVLLTGLISAGPLVLWKDVTVTASGNMAISAGLIGIGMIIN